MLMSKTLKQANLYHYFPSTDAENRRSFRQSGAGGVLPTTTLQCFQSSYVFYIWRMASKLQNLWDLTRQRQRLNREPLPSAQSVPPGLSVDRSLK